MYSFIGNGSICPEPLVVIMILALTGLSGPYPASLSSALPLAGSYVYCCFGLPKNGSTFLNRP